MFIAIVDVGHGNAAVVVDTKGVTLIDTGPGSALLEFLTDEGLTVVDTILISHADKDHIEGLIGILASGAIKVGRVFLNTDSEKKSRLWKDLGVALSVAERIKKVEFSPSLTTNLTNTLDLGDIHIQVVAPSNFLALRGPGSTDAKDRRLTVHSVCAVIRLVHKGNGIVVFPGDIDLVGLTNLIEDCHISLPTEVVVFPHHGGLPGLDDMAVYATSICSIFTPKSVVFSTGRGQHKTPRPQILSAIKTAIGGVDMRCTQLSERCVKTLPPQPAKHLAKNFARGRLANKCCARTIIIDLNAGPGIALPVLKSHQKFIDEAAETPVCRQ